MSEEKQTELSIGEEFLGELERKGEFTGDRLRDRKPEIYRACISLIGSGMGLLTIAKLLKISVNSVSAVKRNESFSIEIEKRAWADKFRTVAGLSAERAIEKLSDDEQAKDIPLNQLAITAGIFTEKAELLTGGATSRVDWVQPAPAVDDFEKYIASLQPAEVMDVTEPVDNGLDQKEIQTKEPGSDGPQAVDEPSSTGDSESHEL